MRSCRAGSASLVLARSRRAAPVMCACRKLCSTSILDNFKEFELLEISLFIEFELLEIDELLTYYQTKRKTTMHGLPAGP